MQNLFADHFVYIYNVPVIFCNVNILLRFSLYVSILRLAISDGMVLFIRLAWPSVYDAGLIQHCNYCNYLYIADGKINTINNNNYYYNYCYYLSIIVKLHFYISVNKLTVLIIIGWG